MRKRPWVQGSTVGKFERGGRNKFVPVWITRSQRPKLSPEVKKMVITKQYKITINLWRLLQWGLIILALYLLWANTTITFTIQ